MIPLNQLTPITFLKSNKHIKVIAVVVSLVISSQLITLCFSFPPDYYHIQLFNSVNSEAIGRLDIQTDIDQSIPKDIFRNESVKIFQESREQMDEKLINFTQVEYKIINHISKNINKYEVDGKVTSLSISSDGLITSVITNNKTLTFVNNYMVNQSWVYKNYHYLSKLDMSSSGKEIITVSLEDHKLIFFNSTNNIPVWNYTSDSTIVDARISSNGNLIVIGTIENKILCFNTSQATPLWEFVMNSSIKNVAISGNSNIIIANSKSDGLYFINAMTSEVLHKITINNIKFIEMDYFGSYLIFADNYRNFYSVDINNNFSQYSFQLGGLISSIDITESGLFYIASTKSGFNPLLNITYVFQRDYTDPIWKYQYTFSINDAAISDNGDKIVIGTDNKKIILFNINSSIPVYIWNTTDPVNIVRIDYSGDNIISSGYYRFNYISPWVNAKFSNLTFNNRTISFSFHVDLSSQLGTYKFRILMSLTDVFEIDKIEIISLVNIINNKPTSDILYISNNRRTNYYKFSGEGFDVDGEIIKYQWYSNIDGFLNNNKTFSHQISPGVHNISLYVIDNDGGISNVSFYIILANNISIRTNYFYFVIALSIISPFSYYFMARKHI